MAKAAVEYFKGKRLRFWDENFFVDMPRAKAIINGMIKENLVMPWETTVRCNYLKEGMIDDEFMEKLAASGCYLLSFGAESGSKLVLNPLSRDTRVIPYSLLPQYFSLLVRVLG